jgi:hypothetical protein
MKSERPALCQVQDVEGACWDVHDARATKYGFDLLFGKPVTRLAIYRCGLPRLIATKPLADFWEANRIKRDGVIFDLPAGRTTLKRVRRRLGFNWLDDNTQFWETHIGELKTLTVREFAARHDIAIEVVFDMRHKLLGRQARDLDWWQEPARLRILLSGVTLREIGEKLSISITHTKRLRDRARQLHKMSTAAEVQICGGAASPGGEPASWPALFSS